MSKEHRRKLTEAEKEKVLKEFEEHVRKYYENMLPEAAILASMEKDEPQD